jgi:site-specific DNA-methyltransferase (adenine-specific)
MTEVIEKTVASPETAERTTAVAVGLKPLVLSHRPLIQAYLGDCMTLMASTADNYYDLAIVDPPYGINYDGETTVKGVAGKANTFSDIQHHRKKDWDFKRPNLSYFTELRRVSKNQIIWGGNYYADLLTAQKGWIFWDKKITNAKNTNFSDGELAWTSFNCILRRFTYDWIGFGYLNNPHGEKKIHPTQKPVALYRWLLKNYAKAGQRILDTHGGSFSSAVACHTEGYEMDIVEIDKEYFDAGIKRFKDATCQLKMF